jgi:glyoxylase I family protein
MKPKAVDFISYISTDMDKSEAFYREALGLEVEVARGEPGERSNGFMELTAGGTAISLTCMPGLPVHPNGVVAIAVDDVSEAIEELRGKGVPIAMETIETPDCFMAVVADPDDNKILLHQRKDGTAG